MEDIKHTKKCTKCQVEKELVEFSPHRLSKDGRQTRCKSCKKEYALANKDKDKARKAYKKWFEANKEKNKENRKIYNKKYYQENKEKQLEYIKKYREENKEKYAEYSKEYYEQNKEKQSEYAKEYYQENKEHYAEYQTERYHSEPDFKLAKIIRSFCFRVTNAVKEDKELRSLEYLGCSLAEFKAHIESQWQEGMTWENHSMHGWHIDHIKPLDWFIKNSDDPWQANHYTNLQPLWAEENLSKSNKF